MLWRLANIKKMLVMVLLVFTINNAFSENVATQRMTLSLKNIDLADAIRILGKFMHLNLVLSPDIVGSISVQWHDVKGEEAFKLLLASQGLSQWSKGNLWFVAPQQELIKRQEEALTWQAALANAAPLLSRTWQIRYAKAQEIARLLEEGSHTLLSKRAVLRMDSRTNRLYVKDSTQNLDQIADFIAKFDKPVRQVLIEARLASVDNDFEQSLGFMFSVQHSLSPLGLPVSPTFAPHFSLAVATLANGSQLDMALAALEDAGKGELISSPSLFTANQQTASIESGEDIPYQETSANGATSVAFKKAVLSLKVTPQIMPNNKILLQLKVNQDRPSNRIVLGVPAISTRQIETNVMVADGQTLVLGGIYELNKESGDQRIPFLSRIPIVGWLFQLKNKKENKRELLIFVTPKIIS